MIVAGGSYREICLVPQWRRIFGSGGRAAIVVSSRSKDTELCTYAGDAFADDVIRTMQSFGIKATVSRIREDISFSYFHPLSLAVRSPEQIKRKRSLKVTGNTVLRFGFVEGDAIIQANYAVYDPQGGPPLQKFEENGSKARHLAYVLNENELLALTRAATVEAAAVELLRGATDVVVVKCGPHGVSVYQADGNVDVIPAYTSEKVFKIGSGDVFSAVFACEWAENGLSPRKAADAASRAVAYYVETRSLALPSNIELNQRKALKPRKKPGRIYLAGPFFDIAKRWLVEEALSALESLGADVFSPLHDVGFGSPEHVAKQDLIGLDGCSAVLALIDGGDPGTLFEVGYARRKNIPWPAPGSEDTELGVFMEPEVSHGETEVYPRVQA